jgi:hypothetical protein
LIDGTQPRLLARSGWGPRTPPRPLGGVLFALVKAAAQQGHPDYPRDKRIFAEARNRFR